MNNTQNTRLSMWGRWALLLLFVVPGWSVASASVQPADSSRVFSREHPLVYEDAWDLYPYVFLNENGEAVGYNVDVLRMIFNELNIPFVIKLRATQDALNDLKAGYSDLMLGMEADYHDEYTRYGQTVVQIFTHSVASKRGEDNPLKDMKDLKNNKVIVHQGSLSHHIMIKRGWGSQAVPYNDMKQAVQMAHSDANNRVLWNTLSLKWLINKFHYNELMLTPINVPHGKYKFMSNNEHLLHQLDSVYTYLNSTGRLQPIQYKWFYPEHKDSGIPSWIWWLAGILLVLSMMSTLYYLVYRSRERRISAAVRRSNDRLLQIMRTSGVHIWMLNIKTATVRRIDEQGRVESSSLSPASFFSSVAPDEYHRIKDAIRQIVRQNKEKVTLDIEARYDPNGTLRHFTMEFSVLRRDKDGRPIDIIGTTSDVTDEMKKQQQVKDTMLRYQSIFDSAMIDTVSYDEHGYINDLNQKASAAFPEGKKMVIEEHISLKDVLGMEDLSIDHLERIHLTQIYRSQDDDRALARHLRRPEMYYELQIVPVYDDAGKFLAAYGTGRDVTEVAKSYMQLCQNVERMKQANQEVNDYIRNIDYVLKNGGVRMVNYSPRSHTLLLYSEIGRLQYEMTQARCLSLTDASSKTVAQRILNSMDSCTRNTVTATIKTTLRAKGGQRLCLYLSFVPVYDEKGALKEYFGMCRDISKIKDTEEKLGRETVLAQQVETVKNAFLRNMSYEIRTPLNSVVGFAELFETEHSSEDEIFFIEEIKRNAAHLLNLINDILFLSRLDAQMIEFKYQSIDFASFFTMRCQTAWTPIQQTGVSYIADNSYKRLVIETDAQNLGVVIDQIISNAVLHTESGYVRASYDYIGEELVMTFQDTGCGIPQQRLEHVFDRFTGSDSQGSGLGLSICHEVVRQMNGKITLRSEVGKGTLIWVSIPCKCIEMER